MKKTVGIKSFIGQDTGFLTPGKQTTTGTIGGSGQGSGISTHGDKEGTGIEEEPEIEPEKPKKETKIERVKRKVKGGIK